MKSYLFEIKAQDSEGSSAAQLLAGGLPRLDVQPQSFQLDGSSDSEILYKLLTNTMGVYCRLAHKDDQDWTKHLPSCKKELKNLIKNL